MKKIKKSIQLKTIEAFRGCTCSSCPCSNNGGSYNNNTGRPQAPSYK